MKTRLLGVFGAILLTSAGAVSSAWGSTFTFDLLPGGGAISGPAGSTIGWGYSITNESATDWLVTTGLNADSFVDGTPSLLFDFPTIAPGSVVTVPFDALTSTGLYMLTCDAAAPVGSLNSGTFILSAQWWDGDPFGGGNYLMDALDASQVYSASVSEANGAIPEPSSWLLALSAIGALMGRKLVSRRHRRI
jgi:hypothetical protein